MNGCPQDLPNAWMKSVKGRNFSVDEYLVRLAERIVPSLGFGADTPRECESWKGALGDKVRELLSPFPAKVPLKPEVLKREEGEGFIREWIVFDSEDGVSVPACLFLPMPAAEKEGRSVLWLSGHEGWRSIWGPDPHAKHPEARQPHGRGAHLERMAREGFVCLNFDNRNFGRRRMENYSDDKDPCNLFLLRASLLGFNPLTLNLWDAMRALDYLESRPEVDSERIGIGGSSYGGTLALYLGPLDERVKTSVVQCYFNTFKEYAIGKPGEPCGVQIIPDILRYAELPDIAALMVSRPLCIMNAIDDSIFAIEVARSAFATVKRAYEVMKVADRVVFHEVPGAHSATDEPFLFSWYEQWL